MDSGTLSSLELPCTLDSTTCPTGGGGDIVDRNNDNIDDNLDGNDSSTDGGNTTNLATGDTTIALEKSNLVTVTSGTSLSTLLNNPLTLVKPTTQKISIDTNTESNVDWPTPVLMKEYVFGTTANGGPANNAGAVYREYRAVSNKKGKERNEVLQVWAWTDSYATQYRNATSSEAPQQAWSFGGNKTALTAMPVAGLATYNGRFVGTAKTSNYIEPDGSDINPNALWRVDGASTVTANFGSGTVIGGLTPETWQSIQPNYTGNYYVKTVSSPGTVAEPHFGFYNSTVALNGTITGNTYTGTATLNDQFVSGDNPMYGGFFGATANETAGVFNVFGTDPAPIGGSAGINDDRAAYLTINGAFHGQ